MTKPSFFERSIVIQVKTWKLTTLMILLCFIAYLAWEYYWYLQIDFAFIKWHTHLLSTLVQSVFFILLPYLIIVKLLSKKYSKQVLTAIAAVIISLFFIELFLIVTGFTKNYIETRSGYYQSPYAQNMGNVYNNRPKHLHYQLESQEYEFERQSNSLGYPDKEWKLRKDTGQLRIVAIGDSFTEGDGAAYDSTYPKLLEGIINLEAKNVEVLNAGVSGSDPFFGYKNFNDRVLKYQPDIVLQTVSSDDLLFDTMLRGGLERFKGDTLSMKRGPWWEWLTATSYVYREFFKTIGFDINKPGGNNKYKLQTEINGLMYELMHSYDSVARKNDVDVYLFIQPLKHEMKDAQYTFDFEDIKALENNLSNTKIVDLMPCFEVYADSNHESTSAYYWYKDGHHNAKGYQMMAHCIENSIKLKTD